MNPSCTASHVIWQIHGQLSTYNRTPEQTLKAAFSGVINQIEQVVNQKFPSALKERVWEEVSPVGVRDLRNIYSTTILTEFLDQYSEEQLAEMQSKRRIYRISSEIWSRCPLQLADTPQQKVIFTAMSDAIKEIAPDFSSVICKALEKEGIKLPEPRLI